MVTSKAIWSLTFQLRQGKDLGQVAGGEEGTADIHHAEAASDKIIRTYL